MACDSECFGLGLVGYWFKIFVLWGVNKVELLRC